MLSIEEKLIFRDVKKAAIVWLLLLRLDPTPVSESNAAEILQIDKETARKYLRTLNELMICTRLGRYDGYNLTESGRQMALPLELSRISDQSSAEIPRSGDFNNNESLIDLDDLTSLSLIKRERGNPAFERGNPAFPEKNSAPVDNLAETVDKSAPSVDNPGMSIDQIIDEILHEKPEKRAILETLLECRISMNWKTVTLLFSDEITPQEIKSQYHQLDKRGLADNTGILITNLLAKYKPRGADFDPDTGHPVECKCYKCIGARNQRFIETQQSGEIYNQWNSED